MAGEIYYTGDCVVITYPRQTPSFKENAIDKKKKRIKELRTRLETEQDPSARENCERIIQEDKKSIANEREFLRHQKNDPKMKRFLEEEAKKKELLARTGKQK